MASIPSTQALIDLEEQYTLPTYNKLPLAIERGEGCTVWDHDGNAYLDFYGGHCVTLLGHCPPRVTAAIQEQAARLIFYSNVAYTSVRARAAERLAGLMPEPLAQVFFCNSGTEANETALKLARKWSGRTGVVAMQHGFHGRTLGSLAATWADKYRMPYQDVLAPVQYVPFGDAEAAARALAGDDVAAVILEPIQSMAGMVTAPDAYFQELRALCDDHGTALVFDEVQTGVGRTGTFSISEQLGVVPDLVSFAKSLGSGVPVGATVASAEIAASVEHGDQGSTFGGGPLAMAALEATLQTIQEDGLMERAPALYEAVAAAVAPHGVAVRGRGCLMGLALDGPAAPVVTALRETGVLVGSSADPHVIRCMPPLVAGQAEVDRFADAFAHALQTASQPA